jgi:hypothetical protein
VLSFQLKTDFFLPAVTCRDRREHGGRAQARRAFKIEN